MNKKQPTMESCILCNSKIERRKIDGELFDKDNDLECNINVIVTLGATYYEVRDSKGYHNYWHIDGAMLVEEDASSFTKELELKVRSDWGEVGDISDKRKEKFTYKEWLAQVVTIFCHGLKHVRDGKVLQEVEKIGFDKELFFDELAYLEFFAMCTALRKKFPKQYEEIMLHLKEMISKAGAIPLKNPTAEINWRIKIDERTIDYMTTWNETLGRRKKIKDDSLLNNPAFTVANQAFVNAYGKEVPKDIRVIMFFSSEFMGAFGGFTNYLKDVDAK